MTFQRGTRVLVTQGGMKHSLAIIRYLARQGAEVHAVVGQDRPRTLAHLSRHTAGTHVMPHRSESGFIGRLLALLESHPFDVLVPVGYPVTEFVARHVDEITRWTRVMCPDKTVCEQAGDKLQMAQLAESLGIPIPRTWQVKSRDDLRRMEDEAFPLVIKGRHESGKGIVSYAANRAELLANFDALCERFHLRAVEEYPILQEYIPGWGCGLCALYQGGVPKRIFMHRRVREYPPSGGSSCCAESFFDGRLLDLGTRLLGHLRWHGVAMVECRFDTRRRRFTLIEVNAKFWGSLELALKAGADFAGDYVRGALGEDLPVSQAYRRIRFQWPFDGDLQHAVSNPAAWTAVLRDLFNPAVAKGFHWTDPLPTLANLYGSGRTLAAAAAKAMQHRLAFR
jgi:predicted ATP-grasp superfamily ATP-dependent carboligase